ncbi:MAG TPA: peptide-methionine (S)-S-oxide reductase MsrA [Draconibacterium sp.]|jgi:peptide-methionine (S)-S-oxide reductase|nr:peptide-methionine (S)-S-oxide reductase MsrA [Draconibacterium sp.]
MKKNIFAFILLMFSMNMMGKELEKATLGGGCFWCTEAVYLELKGVVDVKPGYSGGHVKNPSYKEVCNETTGHAEVVQITFDPAIVSYTEILEVFFVTHDPTTLNRQGNDVGTQYRSAIFYHSETQKQTAQKVIELLTKDKVYNKPIVTEVTAFSVFYPAEDYHINYFARNKNQPYCQFVVAPKVEKFRKVFKEKMK